MFQGWPIEDYLQKFMLDPLFVTAEYWKNMKWLLLNNQFVWDTTHYK